MEISDLTSHLTVYFFLRWAAFYYVVSGRFVSTKDTMMGPDCVGIAPAIMRLVDGFQWKSLDEFRADILPLVRVIVLRPHYACALLPLLFSGIQSHEHSHLPSILRSVLVLGLLHCTPRFTCSTTSVKSISTISMGRNGKGRNCATLPEANEIKIRHRLEMFCLLVYHALHLPLFLYPVDTNLLLVSFIFSFAFFVYQPKPATYIQGGFSIGHASECQRSKDGRDVFHTST